MGNFQVSLGYIPIITAGIEFVWSKYTLFLWGSYLLMHGCIFHNRKKNPTKSQIMKLTWINLSVTAHSIGIHNILESRCKFVGSYKRWGSGVGGDTIDKGRNRCTALPLKY